MYPKLNNSNYETPLNVKIPNKESFTLILKIPLKKKEYLQTCRNKIKRLLKSFLKSFKCRINKVINMKKAINQELMRANNKRSILDLIQKNGPISKAEIAYILGLSSTSVSTFINELINDKKIYECGVAKSTGGRKSILYQVDPEAFYVIGIDLQVDRIISILTNSIGEAVTSAETLFSNKDEWQVISILNQTIDKLIAEKKLPFAKVGGIGIGVPGIVQNKTGLIEFAPNLGWQNVNLQQLLKIDKPVLIENEANAAAIGEKTFGAAAKVNNFIYISIEIGVGCGLMINGRIYTGNAYHAGEFGHMTVQPEGPICRCGNRGCWEIYVSNDTAIKLYNEHSPIKIKSYEDFLDLIRDNDQPALNVLEIIVKYLGIGIANLVNGLNPEMVIIGGKITEIKNLIHHQLLKQIKDHCLDKTFSGLTLEFSKLDNKATVMGMAGLVIEHVMSSL